MKTNKKSHLLKTTIKTALCVSASIGLTQSIYAEKPAQDIWQTAYLQFQQGNAQSCYQSLMKLNHMLGQISYDRLLGLCAQGAGYNNQALLAYNRIISQQEQNAEIRLERARVFYNLNLYSESRREFKKLLAHNPPAAAKTLIQNYLSAIKKTTTKIRPYTRLKISTVLGHDDNVNSASELDEFLGFTLNDNSKASSSNYAGINLRAEHQFEFTHNMGLKISTSLGAKHYPDADFVDQELITVGVGFSKFFEASSINVDLLAYRQSVDSEFNSRGALIRSAYRKKYWTTLANSSYVSVGALRYSDNLTVKDVNQYSIGSAFTYTPSSLPKDSFTLDLSIGHDYPLFTDSNYEADFGSLKLFHRHKFSTKLKSSALVEYKKYSYENPFFALSFPDDRDDDALSARFALDWGVNKNFKLSPSFAYRDNNSNVDLFTYSRWYAEINASYQWIW